MCLNFERVVFAFLHLFPWRHKLLNISQQDLWCHQAAHFEICSFWIRSGLPDGPYRTAQCPPNIFRKIRMRDCVWNTILKVPARNRQKIWPFRPQNRTLIVKNAVHSFFTIEGPFWGLNKRIFCRFLGNLKIAFRTQSCGQIFLKSSEGTGLVWSGPSGSPDLKRTLYTYSYEDINS